MEAATPLVSNKDFRQFLQTPKGNSVGATPGSLYPKSDSKVKQTKQKEEKKKDKEKEEQSYRDRARERREGKNLDYARDDVLLETLAATKGASQYITKDDTLQLGGDYDSTHLVKGLDYNLLRKQKERTGDAKEETAVAPTEPQEEQIKFKTVMARNLHEYMFKPQTQDVKQFFAPGRMSFVYEEGEDGNIESIPVTLHRSKNDAPKTKEALFANMDNNVLENLAKIIQYLTVGTHHGKKEKRRERQELLQQIWDQNKSSQAPLGQRKSNKNDEKLAYGKMSDNKNDADRLFDDIEDDEDNDYRKPKEIDKLDQRKVASLFDDEKHQDEDFTFFTENLKKQGKIPEKQPPGLSKKEQKQMQDRQFLSSGSQYSKGPPTAEEKFSSLRAQAAHNAQQEGGNDMDVNLGKNSMKNQLAQDAYQECFPDQLGGAWEYDSDDNRDDYTQMDSKAKGMSRYDFDTEEDWQRQKEQKEAMPKAAFQFGVKMGDGRRQQKSLDGRGQVMRKEQKFNKDMRNLEKFMNQKFEKDYGAAFQQRDEPAQPASKKKRLNV